MVADVEDNGQHDLKHVVLLYDEFWRARLRHRVC